MEKATNVDEGRQDEIISIQGMYKDYFLDYASYVILERAIPAIEDGLKPVQRRILHVLYDMDDGRYHKVANIIGQTMQYHPHGDAAIGDALVNLGQKDLLIDTQGNWGDVNTGDSAAASRYIEARLTKFALHVAFNPQTTEWQASYDGRKKEPIALPMKFPLLLALGAEGIAVGLSTKVLPHNFIELIEASIACLRGERKTIFPDFQTGGMIDIGEYNDGQRGGRVKVRAKVEQLDKNTLVIRELPYGITTGGLIESIIKANDKGKIKIKKVSDHTAENVEIQVELAPGVSPDVTVDALYAFTDCEVSISPNACVIVDNKPYFLSVSDLLRISTENAKELLRQELEIKKHELEEKWHFASLEKIFIEKRIYRDIEECETWEAVLEAIMAGLKKFVATPSDPPLPKDKRIKLLRDISGEDIVRLTEIKIKRISKYNSFKADELIAEMENELELVKHDLAHLVDFVVAFFQDLIVKFGKGKERRTKITNFDVIAATEVIANNAKLYVDRQEGFIGWGLKKDEFVAECSEIDDVIVFRKDGKFSVSRISEKVFVGKDILHVAVWKKADDRSTYNMAYADGKSGRSFVKRFNVTAITRDKEYDLTQGTPGSRLLYFSANPNGEAEVVTVQLSQGCKAKIKVFDFDFSTLAIKGRSSQGNLLTKYPVKKVSLKEAGKSTIGAQKIWLDPSVGRLNTESRGRLLGEFDSGAQLFAIYRDGSYEVIDLDLSRRLNADDMLILQPFDPEVIVNVVYFEANKQWTMVKRFKVETTSSNTRHSFLSDHKNSRLLFVSIAAEPHFYYLAKGKRRDTEQIVNLAEFMEVKGWKALGNRLADKLIDEWREVVSKPSTEEKPDSLDVGDSIDLDLPEGNGVQGELFE